MDIRATSEEDVKKELSPDFQTFPGMQKAEQMQEQTEESSQKPLSQE